MRNGPFNSQKLLPHEEDQLRVADMVQYLLRLAKLYEADKTGNMELSKGLRAVAQALRPYADCLTSELTDALKKKASPISKRKIASTRPQLPTSLENVSQTVVKEILDDDNYTNQQIAELGYQRFGISRSKLKSLRKKDAQDTVRAALEHERSLEAISREARKGANARLQLVP